MIEITMYIAYGIAILVWVVLSALLIRHIQVLTEIRGSIRVVIVTYFIIALVLIVFSFTALIWPGFDISDALFPVTTPSRTGGGF